MAAEPLAAGGLAGSQALVVERLADLLQRERPPRIRIVLLTGLGDVVHGLPVVNALRRARPDCRITWVVEPMPAGILMPHPAVDRVVVFHKKAGARGVARLRRDLAAEERPDLTLNLNIYFKSVFPTILRGARHRLGFDRDRSRDGVWLFANHHLLPGPRRHTQDLFLEFLARLGVPAEPLAWRLQLTPVEQREQAEFFAPLAGQPVVALVPASANPHKDWVAERHAALVDALASDFGARVVLIGGPAAREQAVARLVMAGAQSSPLQALGDGVRRLLWLIGGSDLVIAPDTGPVHIARALEVPVIGLYGHTNPWRVGPYRRYEDLWVDRYNDPGEAPDPSRAEPRHGRMDRIRVADILGRADRVLGPQAQAHAQARPQAQKGGLPHPTGGARDAGATPRREH